MRIKKIASNIPEIDLTPLIDIVFQLIAFFMLITNFEQTQADERVKLARDPLALPPKVARDKDLVLNVGFNRDADGDIIPDPQTKDRNPRVFFGGDAIPIPAFPVHLATEAKLQRDEGTEPADVTIVLRADREVPTGMVQELITQAQEAGYVKFALAATQQQLE
ncbi:MAG: biopolymer transporter ExbD [Planctomycetaceae bacterium]